MTWLNDFIENNLDKTVLASAGISAGNFGAKLAEIMQDGNIDSQEWVELIQFGSNGFVMIILSFLYVYLMAKK